MVLDPETEHAPAAEGIQRVIDQVHAIHHLHGDVAPDLGDVCAGKSRGPDFCSGPNAEKHKHTFNMFNIPLCQGFIHFGKKTSSNHRCALPLLLPFFSLCQSPGHSPSSMKWTSKALWTPRHCAQGPITMLQPGVTKPAPGVMHTSPATAPTEAPTLLDLPPPTLGSHRAGGRAGGCFTGQSDWS